MQNLLEMIILNIIIIEKNIRNFRKLSKIYPQTQGRPQGGGGKLPRPETEKIVVENLCYFPELYKMTKVLEDRRENG